MKIYLKSLLKKSIDKFSHFQFSPNLSNSTSTSIQKKSTIMSQLIKLFPSKNWTQKKNNKTIKRKTITWVCEFWLHKKNRMECIKIGSCSKKNFHCHFLVLVSNGGHQYLLKACNWYDYFIYVRVCVWFLMCTWIKSTQIIIIKMNVCLSVENCAFHFRRPLL